MFLAIRTSMGILSKRWLIQTKLRHKMKMENRVWRKEGCRRFFTPVA
jgi:hypothetical protein